MSLQAKVAEELMVVEKRECMVGWWLTDWSDFRLELVVLGPPISFKRAKRIIRTNRHASLALTPEASAYMQSAATQFKRQCMTINQIPKHIEVNAAIRSYLPTKRLTDASNLYQGVEDAMQSCRSTCKPWCQMHAGILADDCQIRTHNGSDRLYDRDNTRVEIVLTPYRNKIEVEVEKNESGSKERQA